MPAPKDQPDTLSLVIINTVRAEELIAAGWFQQLAGNPLGPTLRYPQLAAGWSFPSQAATWTAMKAISPPPRLCVGRSRN